MSLLDNASLLLTPNAYKEGKLYSVIPSNGNGDFTATRATTATRVNSAGLVDLVPYNLLQYSEMFSNAVWTKSASSVTANITTAPDGTLTADKLVEDTTNASHQVFQSVSNLATSLSYTLSVYLKASERFRFRVRFTGYSGANDVSIDLNTQTTVGGGTLTSVGNGWFRFTYTINTGTGAGFPLVSITLQDDSGNNTYLGNGTSGGFVWGAQVVEGTSARDYLRTETRLNIPRIDYSLGGCPNILLEPQRTNLVLWSEQFDNASWAKTSVTITANTTTSPSGILNADTLDEGTNASTHRLLGNTVGIVAGSTNCFSLYVKKNTLPTFRISISDQADPSKWIAAQFDLDTQTFTTGVGSTAGSTITSASIQSVGNGWFRVNLVGSMTTTTSVFPVVFCSNGAAIVGSDARGGNSYTGTNRTLFLWGAQFEAGAYATSYIPTTTASVTRNSDSITRNNIFTNGLITAAGGTWFVELRNNVSRTRDASNVGFGVGSSSALDVNALYIRQEFPTSRNSIMKRVSGSNTVLFTTTTEIAKIAIKWNGTTADVFVNGVKQVSATAFTATTLEWLVAFSTDVPKFINEMALFPTPLTDAQCLALTA